MPRLPAAFLAAALLAPIALLAIAAPAGAQAPASQAPAPAAPLAVPPAAPEPSAAAVAAGREVVVASGLSKSFEAIIPQFVMQAREGFVRQRPELSGDIADAVALVSRDLEGSRDEMIDVAARLYAGRMSEEELRASAAFFRTPAGQKYVDVQPNLLDDLFNDMQTWSTRLSATITDKVRGEMRKKGKEL